MNSNSEGSLYQRVLGRTWETLPDSLKAIHGAESDTTVSGKASVTRGTGVLANIVAALVGFPKTQEDADVTVKFERSATGETWHRRFGRRGFSSRQFEKRRQSETLISERFGPLTFDLAPVIDSGQLHIVIRSWRFLFIPMPRFLAPNGSIFEYENDRKFHFHVDVRAPIIGKIVKYEGYFLPQQTVSNQ